MYHTIIIAGNVGKDAEMRYTSNGQPVTTFPVATNRKYTGNDGQTVEETIWFRVTTWGKQAEACDQYVKKGSKVLVEGRLTPDANTGGPRVWSDRDGAARASFEVNASAVRFLSSAHADNGAAPIGNGTPEVPAGEPENDIPF
jgi:single-strand DNA-binding protein